MPGWAHEIRHVEETLRAPQWLRFVAVHGSGIGHVGPKQMRQACSQPVEPDMQPQETDSRFGTPRQRLMLGLCSVLENFGHSRPASRDGSGANDPQRKWNKSSLDDLVGALLEVQWHVEAERLGGLDVDQQLELGRLLHRKVTGFCTF